MIKNVTICVTFSNKRAEKSCESSSSGKLRVLPCPQNSVIYDDEWTEICVLIPQILSAYSQSIALHPPF